MAVAVESELVTLANEISPCATAAVGAYDNPVVSR